jgi:outer membrane biosynthesis protein TonB
MNNLDGRRCNVRLLAIIAMGILAMVSAGTASAQSNQEVESNMSCIERLEIPRYPPLADTARISGTVTAIVTISPDGTVQKTVMEGNAHPLLVPGVENTVRAARFSKTCGGKSIRLVFNFVLGQDRDNWQRVSFGYPNQFWISAPPRIVQP